MCIRDSAERWAEALGAALGAAFLGGTSSPTGVTLPAAWKPQSRSFALSL